MQNQTAHAHHITDIIKVMNGGIEFYQEAKTKLDDTTYNAFFDRMIGAKAEAVAELQPFAVDQQGEVETDTDNIVKARQAYTREGANKSTKTQSFREIVK